MSACCCLPPWLDDATNRLRACCTTPHILHFLPCIYLTPCNLPCSTCSEPVDKESFLRNLWWCFDTLAEKAGDDSGKPAYFRFLTMLGAWGC